MIISNFYSKSFSQKSLDRPDCTKFFFGCRPFFTSDSNNRHRKANDDGTEIEANDTNRDLGGAL